MLTLTNFVYIWRREENRILESPHDDRHGHCRNVFRETDAERNTYRYGKRDREIEKERQRDREREIKKENLAYAYKYGLFGMYSGL